MSICMQSIGMFILLLMFLICVMILLFQNWVTVFEALVKQCFSTLYCIEILKKKILQTINICFIFSNNQFPCKIEAIILGQLSFLFGAPYFQK